MNKIRYLIEFLLTKAIISIFSILSPQASSNAGSFLARKIGKLHNTSRLALKSMANAIPSLSKADRIKILDDMWDNLGRIAGEYTHISKNNSENLIKNFIVDKDDLEKEINELKQLDLSKGGIIFSAHIGNWEIGPKALSHFGLKVATLYRPLNNPYVEKLTAKMRGTKLIAKGNAGNKQIIESLKNGELIIILADQKITDGKMVKFFNKKALTTTSIARIALKYNIPLIPARTIRIGKKFKFKINIEKPLDFQKTNDINKDILNLTRLINIKIENWIKEYPAQWFWVHNRWKN